tara:strand:+ start:1018 stop:1362 length:345 start_codon:yes stop_codon:yes gene_type:complete
MVNKKDLQEQCGNDARIVLERAKMIEKRKDGLRFDEVFCSSCGEGFGPGNHGFSHCEHHSSEALELRSSYHVVVADIVAMSTRLVLMPASFFESLQSSALALYEDGSRFQRRSK